LKEEGRRKKEERRRKKEKFYPISNRKSQSKIPNPKSKID
jgi:hypothetical protein